MIQTLDLCGDINDSEASGKRDTEGRKGTIIN